jgi:hypothetical protein
LFYCGIDLSGLGEVKYLIAAKGKELLVCYNYEYKLERRYCLEMFLWRVEMASRLFIGIGGEVV